MRTRLKKVSASGESLLREGDEFVLLRGERRTRLGKQTSAGLAAGLELVVSEKPLTILESPPLASLAGIAAIAKGDHGQALVVLEDSPEARTALTESGLTAFELVDQPGFLFGSSLPLSKDATARERTVQKLLRKDAAEPAPEERFVLGVVLEPDVVDSQGDTYSADEVRKAAHRWMENYAQLGKQHSELVTGKLKILESFVAPIDFSIGEEVVKAGTWMLAIRVADDDLWTAVKSGSFTGFSIGGTAMRKREFGRTTSWSRIKPVIVLNRLSQPVQVPVSMNSRLSSTRTE